MNINLKLKFPFALMPWVIDIQPMTICTLKLNFMKVGQKLKETVIDYIGQRIKFLQLKQMNFKSLCLYISIWLVSTQARQLTTQSYPYCDEWNKCSSTTQCISKQCVPLDCDANTCCSSGFQCWNGKCVSMAYVKNDGPYCDQWTPCPKNQQCIKKKCVPLDCKYETDCVEGFSCFNNKCLATDYAGSTQGYCDQWTKCSPTHQCVNKLCVPLTCSRTPDCIVDYVCYSGSCVQINPNHTRGRYCDAQNQCDTLHVCKESQCFWK